MIGYQNLYTENGLNSFSQLRRSTDMCYSRGATFEVILTGDTMFPTMELDLDLFVEDEKVGRLSVVPYSIISSGTTYYYKFNIRPYTYLSNFIKSEHHKYIYRYDWFRTNEDINDNNPYPNIIKWNARYGYRYITNGYTIKEYTGSPTNDLCHYTMINICQDATSFIPSGFTNTGNYFHLIGGSFQLDDKYYKRNFDQEVGSTIKDGKLYTLDINRTLSPISQYLLDYPSVPEESETSRFLTDAPRIQNVYEHETHCLYFLNGLTGDRQFIEGHFVWIEFFDENDNRIDYTYNEFNIDNPTSGYTPTLKIYKFPCGPKDLYATYETIDFTNVAYYTVQICGGVTEPVYPVSEVFYFYLKRDCPKHNTRLVWLNDKGGYDYYTFTDYREDNLKIDRQTFDNKYYSTNIDSPDRDYGRTVRQFDSNVDIETILETEYLTQGEGDWLTQLFYSSQVYEIKESFISPLDQQDILYCDLRPVQILSTEVKKIDKKHQKLSKYRITMKYSNDYFTVKSF